VSVGDAQVAYQISGEGPLDLLYFYGVGSHIELHRDHPHHAEFFTRLAAFSRLIVFDLRGTGGSDPLPNEALPSWEDWADDVRAVLDAAGSARAAIYAESAAGPVAMLFAATQPERVRALVLANTAARFLVADDYPIGASPAQAAAAVKWFSRVWGTDEMLRVTGGAMARDPEWSAALTRMFRAAATPRAAAAQYRYLFEHVDVRAALPAIQVPTLVIHTTGNPSLSIEHGRYLAEHIEGARLLEVPGASSGWSSYADMRKIVDEVSEFLTGQQASADIDRVLTTVLFTDLVGSTERVAALGDEGWRLQLDAHDRAVRRQLHRFRGREINTTGDGFLAAFDGPGRAIRCARAITDAASSLGLSVRVGLHTGECEVRGDDLGGVAVHIAARVGSAARPNQVLVTRTVRDLVAGSGIEFTEGGEHELKGLPGTWSLFAVEG
jgi:class 3 adenylate cyclase